MEQDYLSVEIVEKSSRFARKMATALIDFLEAHDLLGSIEVKGIDQTIFMGMAASFQLQEWASLGILAHIPFHADRYDLVCQHATDLSAKHNIEHLKSLALFLDVGRYFVSNFTLLQNYSGAARNAGTPQSNLWKSSVFAEINPNRFTLHSIPPVITTKSVTQKDTTPPRHNTNGTWSEKQAAEFSGYSQSTLKRMRTDGEIPHTLYRQRTKGGKILYHPKAFMAWFEQHPKK